MNQRLQRIRLLLKVASHHQKLILTMIRVDPQINLSIKTEQPIKSMLRNLNISFYNPQKIIALRDALFGKIICRLNNTRATLLLSFRSNTNLKVHWLITQRSLNRIQNLLSIFRIETSIVTGIPASTLKTIETRCQQIISAAQKS